MAETPVLPNSPTPGAERNDSSQRVVVTVVSGVAGSLLFAAGAVLAIWSYAQNGFDLNDWKFWVGYPAMIASIFLFVWLLQWNKDVDRLDPAVRRTLYGYNIFLGMMFLGAILIFGNILVTQYGHIFGIKPSYDWTSQGVFTLQDVSVQHAKALERPVKIIAIYYDRTKTSQFEQLFKLFTAANKNITWEFMDPVEDPVRTEDFFKKYPDALVRAPGGLLEQSIVVFYGTGDDAPHKVVKDSELFKVDLKEMDLMTGARGGDRSFHGENAVTSTFRALVEDKKTNLFFTTGHGELDLNNSESRTEDSTRGIGMLKQRLTDQSIRTETVNLIKSDVPNDANVLVIAGPKSGFEPSEIEKVREFMNRKESDGSRSGRLLVLLDSPAETARGAPHDAGLGGLLAEFNVDAKENLVYDADSMLQRPDQLVVVMDSEASPHQIVSPLKNRWALMIRAREIAPKSSHPPGMPGAPPQKFTVSKLFSSSAEGRSWAQADYANPRPNPNAANNTRGPVSLGVAVSEGGSPPMPPSPMAPPPPPSNSTPVAVVFGDATFASNYLVSQKPENEDLFLNAVNWLGGRIADIGIQPKTKKYARLSLDNAGYYTIVLEPFFHFVAMAGFIAALVWLVRADRLQLLWLPVGATIVWLGIYTVLARVFIGGFQTEPARLSIMRVLLTCAMLWGVGLTMWVSRLRPARPTGT